MTDLGSRLDVDTGPFMDTAAVLTCLDLFITSDTAVAHLAGALGVPVWMPLSTTPDWRWLTEREDNPWYPDDADLPPAAVHGLGAGLRADGRRAAQGRARPRFRRRSVAIEAAPGELIDKITILEIKAERIGDPEKLRNVRTELDALCDGARPDDSAVGRARVADGRAARRQRGAVGHRRRDPGCERDGDFGPQFVELARSVYQTNDRRAAIKRRINERLGSQIVEEKSYRGEP